MMAAEMVLSLRETYSWIQLVMVLPCADQAERWSVADRQRWELLIQQSDHVETLTAVFDKGYMFRRNRYLVEHSDLVLAAYDGSGEGGTAMTVDYAHRQGRKVRRLAFEPRCECQLRQTCHADMLFLFRRSYIIQQKAELFYINFSASFVGGLLAQQSPFF